VAGVDLVLLGSTGLLRGLTVATIQIKSWSQRPADDRAWRYRDLTEDQFNVLAGKRHVPAFLVFVVVPTDANNYVRARRERLELCHAAYWKSFADQPPIENATAQRKVPAFDIPQENLLTVETLSRLCSGGAPVPGPGGHSLASGR
jgi:hypothetical protein